jgi:hypothetical protein
MAGPTPQEIADRYTRRSLALIRYANNLAASADRDIRALGLELRGILLGFDAEMTRRDLIAFLRRIDDAVSTTFRNITAAQAESLAELAAIEAAFAARAGVASRGATESAIATAIRNLVVQGAPLSDQWRRIASDLSFRLGAAVRDAYAQSQAPTDLAAVIGTGRTIGGGQLDGVRRAARSLTGTAVDTAAYAGRIATWRAGGVNALQWHSVLDSHTTVGCALRAGLLYDLDFKPIGHDIPIERPPPRHWNCRSILLPMRFRAGAPMPVSPQPKFRQWFDSLSAEEQDELFGVGRADLFRRGVITQSDLVNQRGRVLTLDELRKLR